MVRLRMDFFIRSSRAIWSRMLIMLLDSTTLLMESLAAVSAFSDL